MNDIVAKISQECLEKGFLLEKIWNSYIEILQKIVLENEKMKK